MARVTGFGLGSAVVALVVYLQVLPHVLAFVIPFDAWMEIKRVDVADTLQGEPIRVAVDRTIHRDFDAAYRVNIRKVTPTGFEQFCTRGERDVPYRLGAEFGSGRDLDWYMGIPPNAPCEPPVDMTPGRYYLIVEHWIPILGGFVTLHNVKQSNTFTVYAPGQAPATERQVQKRVEEAVTP